MAGEDNVKNDMKICPQCGNEVDIDTKFCPECGYNLSMELRCPICNTPFKLNQKRCKKCSTPLPKITKKFPKEVRGFNFAAFFFSFIWSSCHRCFWPLIVLIPFLGVLLAFPVALYLGFCGNKIAWENYDGADVEEFKNKERVWNKVAWITAAGMAIFTIIIILSMYLFAILPNTKKLEKIVEEYNKQNYSSFCVSQVEDYDECAGSYKKVYESIGEISKIRFRNVNIESKPGYQVTNICAIARTQKQNKDCSLCVQLVKVGENNERVAKFNVGF